jgi:anti-anti-sigma factor
MDHVDAFRLSIGRAGGTLTVTVAGEVDLATTDRLRDCAGSVLAGMGGNDPAQRMVIQVSGVSFIDASGLGALVALRNTALKRGIPLLLGGVSPELRRLLALTELTGHFPITED